ncbi:MAG: leucyl aminopeptidase [Deltaproteobacteria bacterium]|nr:leucyl aminopeptidase [Deltaproteobacteria bacterium]
MNITIANSSILDVEADLLAIAVTPDTLSETLGAISEAFGGTLLDTLENDEFTGKAGSSASYATFGKIAAKRLIVLGMGDADTSGIQQAAGQAGHAARSRGVSSVALAMGTLDSTQSQLAIEAFYAGTYRFDKYKAEDKRKAPASQLTLIGDVNAEGVKRGQAVGGGQDLARDLVNEPAAAIYPESLADVALSLASDTMTVDVWDENKILAAGMGGIMGVGQGSDRKPRFIHMIYKPAGTPRKKIALVGKGVTFDAGGYSLKPSGSMLTMRCDMAGSAAVIGAMKSIRDLAPDVEVHGIVGAVENLVSGNAYKLGDILTMYSGKTVEIHNTDAEGRLVLADCITYASKLDVDCIVDLATLTGAAVVALGDHYVALFSKDDDLSSSLLNSSVDAGENVWQLPLPDHYKDQLKAEWGTIKNVGGRSAGCITAALFLSEFVDGPKWAHMDIAGPAFLDKKFRHFVPGGTGVMVPTLTRFVES